MAGELRLQCKWEVKERNSKTGLYEVVLTRYNVWTNYGLTALAAVPSGQFLSAAILRPGLLVLSSPDRKWPLSRVFRLLWVDSYNGSPGKEHYTHELRNEVVAGSEPA
ncbi:MAG: hypothetical protein C5B60_06685 [Chloroflexi bacterium]|nr:MAG: hypothetical protein C5B60_06685 [Chloroflexota bacterium]